MGGGGSDGNMYTIIIIQQQLALNSRANCSDMMFHTINSLSHLLLLIKTVSNEGTSNNRILTLLFIQHGVPKRHFGGLSNKSIGN